MIRGAWYEQALALAGALCALVSGLSMWGFTVDDALIPLRYAHHLVSGRGYGFDANGPPTDGVTPLPWVPLIAVLCRGDDLVVALERVKFLGLIVWTVAAGALGWALAKRSRRAASSTAHALVALFVLALAFPVGAWAASGLETGVATALATLAVTSFERPYRTALLAGLSATLRPELVVWATVLSAGASLCSRASKGGHNDHAAKDCAIDGAVGGNVLADKASLDGARDLVMAVLLAVGPFLTCTALRLYLFGRAAPLALLAKPSDLRHGFVYAGAAAIVVLTPVLVFAPLSLLRASGFARVVVSATCAHVVVLVAVGGDWMPYARLMVPIAPGLTLVFVELGRVARAGSTLARSVLAVTLGGLLVLRAAPQGRHVHEDRKDLIARARPLLAGARVVAALDVGWVGAATDATIMDLAGLTDPRIASLPGGHTSKSVDSAMLLDRAVDTVVIYGAPRAVERRLLESALFSERFERTSEIFFGRAQSYEIYRRRR